MDKTTAHKATRPLTQREETNRRIAKNAKSLGIACLVTGIIYAVLIGMTLLMVTGADQLAHSGPSEMAGDIPVNGLNALFLAMAAILGNAMLSFIVVVEVVLFVVALIYNLSNYREHKFSPARPLIFASIGFVLTIAAFFIFGYGRFLFV